MCWCVGVLVCWCVLVCVGESGCAILHGTRRVSRIGLIIDLAATRREVSARVRAASASPDNSRLEF